MGSKRLRSKGRILEIGRTTDTEALGRPNVLNLALTIDKGFVLLEFMEKCLRKMF
jgi:hypothetical protein